MAIKEVDDHYGEIGPSSEGMHKKHTYKKITMKSSLIAKAMVVVVASTVVTEVAVEVVAKENGEEKKNSYSIIEVFEEEEEEVKLVDPAFGEVSCKYDWKTSTTNIDLDVTLNDARRLNSVTITFNSNTYDCDVDENNHISFTSSDRLEKKNYYGNIEINYKIGDEYRTAFQGYSFNAFVPDPATLDEISVSYNNSVISVSALTTLNDSVIENAQVTIEDTDYELTCDSTGTKYTTKINKYLKDGTYQAVIKIEYDRDGMKESIQKPVEFTVKNPVVATKAPTIDIEKKTFDNEYSSLDLIFKVNKNDASKINSVELQYYVGEYQYSDSLEVNPDGYYEYSIECNMEDFHDFSIVVKYTMNGKTGTVTKDFAIDTVIEIMPPYFDQLYGTYNADTPSVHFVYSVAKMDAVISKMTLYYTQYGVETEVEINYDDNYAGTYDLVVDDVSTYMFWIRVYYTIDGLEDMIEQTVDVPY